MRRLAARAARRYVAGSTATDALAAARGRPATIGYWDSGRETPEDVARQYAAAAEACEGVDAYVSVKAPAVAFDADLLPPTPHLDAMGPDTVERTWQLAETVPVLGVTLPGRWRRSVTDADRVAELGVRVRVVKGQFPSDDDVDPRAGFLAVVERLAERGVRIAVATHDRALADEALRRAPDAEVEQLYGLRPLGLPARVYVPYGTAYLPYAVKQLRRNPRIAWWLLRDLASR
jgi:proline dehydrogenase